MRNKRLILRTSLRCYIASGIHEGSSTILKPGTILVLTFVDGDEATLQSVYATTQFTVSSVALLLASSEDN